MSFSTSTTSLVGPCPAGPSGAAPLALRATSPLRGEELGCLLFFLRVLDHCEDARCDDPRGGDLWDNATQTVFGEGSEHARMMLVGEQPGDQEDLQGKPFVGPAGRLLERALEEAGIDRRRVYVTNAVKHFRWTRRGKRRLHEK